MEAEKTGFSNAAQKLLYVQQNLKAPKGQYNSFGDYHYRSCEDIQEALKPLLNETNRFYIKAVATFRDTETNESISNSAYAREIEARSKMDAAQITGSCSSYARKYALNGLFCIDDAKDPDALGNETAKSNQPQQRQQAYKQPPKLKKEFQSNLQGEAERTGTDLKKVCERYRVRNIEDMTEQQYKWAMSAFSKMESMPPPVQEGQMEMFADYGEYDPDGLPFR